MLRIFYARPINDSAPREITKKIENVLNMEHVAMPIQYENKIYVILYKQFKDNIEAIKKVRQLKKKHPNFILGGIHEIEITN